MNFKCEYCNKSFKLERTIVAHLCPKKKRFLQKDDQHVRLGLKYFNKWYQISMGSNGHKDYATFMKSQYYAAFVRFGLYVMEARVISPDRYLEWLIKAQKPVDVWCKDSVYNQYLSEESKRETAERALERFVIHADTWATRTGSHWTEYWELVQPHTMVNDIKMGKISPWIFLGYDPARKQLEELPTEMLTEVANTIDMTFWQRKIDVNKPTVSWITSILDTI
jgi:hypothetical protein